MTKTATENMTISAADIGSVTDVVAKAPKTRKVYMYRHQKAGIVNTHVFLKPPTAEQMAPIKAAMERLHGREGWGMIHEAELIDDEIPGFPEVENNGSRENVAAAGAPTISGTGTVTNPTK